MIQNRQQIFHSSLPPTVSSSKMPIPAPPPSGAKLTLPGKSAPTSSSPSPHVYSHLKHYKSSPHLRPYQGRVISIASYDEEEEVEEIPPMSLEEFVEVYSTMLPLPMKVKRGYHGGDEKHSIATGDVYNIHFVKRTKVVVLRDNRGATFNIPLNSAVQFAPVFYPPNEAKDKAGTTYEKVSELLSLKHLPKVIRATKPHVRVDPKSTIEVSEVFIVEGVTSLSVRKKALKVYSVTCNTNKVLLPDSVGGFSTDPSLTCLYLLEIIQHLLNHLPIDVRVVMNDCDLSNELPFYLTKEVAALSHLDSETSLIASTSWGLNEVVSEEDQSPVEIPVDLPIEVVVQTPDDAREAFLSDHTKRLYERFDPSQIRRLRARNIRRGFEKEGMELERPERIYDLPYYINKRNKSRTANPAKPTRSRSANDAKSPNLQPRLSTPSADSVDSPYDLAYQPVARHTRKKVTPSLKSQHAAPEPQREKSPSPARNSSEGSPGVNGRDRPQLPPPATSASGVENKRELLENRVEILEIEVHALRAEIAKLKKQVLPSSSSSPSSSEDRKKNIEHLKTLSVDEVGEMLEQMNIGQYRDKFLEERVNGEIISQVTMETLKIELGVTSRLHQLRLWRIITGDMSPSPSC